MQPSTIAVWIAIIGGMALLLDEGTNWGEAPRTELTHYEFMQKVDSNLVASARSITPPSLPTRTGDYRKFLCDGSRRRPKRWAQTATDGSFVPHESPAHRGGGEQVVGGAEN